MIFIDNYPLEYSVIIEIILLYAMETPYHFGSENLLFSLLNNHRVMNID